MEAEKPGCVRPVKIDVEGAVSGMIATEDAKTPAGADDFLVKPVAWDTLRERIAKLFERDEATEDVRPGATN